MIKWYIDKNIDHAEEEVKKKETAQVCPGCKKCNYEGFYRDYDGSWKGDCYEQM